MDINEFRKHAARYRALLQEAEALKEDMKELEAETKDAANCTNMDIRAMKRWLKADVTGKVERLVREAEDSEAIGGILGLIDKKNVDKNFVGLSGVAHATPEPEAFDAETGEVIEPEPEGAPPPAPPAPPQKPAYTGSSFSIDPDHKPDMPDIPPFLDRRHEAAAAE